MSFCFAMGRGFEPLLFICSQIKNGFGREPKAWEKRSHKPWRNALPQAMYPSPLTIFLPWEEDSHTPSKLCFELGSQTRQSHLGARSQGTRRSSFPQGNASLQIKLVHKFKDTNRCPFLLAKNEILTLFELCYARLQRDVPDRLRGRKCILDYNIES